jgi:hypothetical protein
MNFDEVWERVKTETGMQHLHELATFLEKKRPFISAKKKANKFETDWAFKIAQEYGLSTDWIMTGEGQKTNRNVARKSEEQHHEFIVLISRWFNELINNDPEREGWFKYNFIDAFPKFENWINIKETKENTHGRQPQTVRETVD